MFKSGFVNIIGKPNVGKSTLMNALVGEKMSIITPKPQTTRHRILGILSGENFQLIFHNNVFLIFIKNFYLNIFNKNKQSFFIYNSQIHSLFVYYY